MISPQWFTETDYEPAAFQRFFYSDQLTAFFGKINLGTFGKHAAIRLLSRIPSVALKGIVQKLSKGEDLSDVDRLILIFCAIQRKQSLFWTILHSGTTQVQRNMKTI